MPAVARLISAFRRRKKVVKFCRHNVLARDGWKCMYCGEKKKTEDLTYDHVIPRSKGGKTCWENIVSACTDCNARKAARTPVEAGMYPLKSPERPAWVPIFSINTHKDHIPSAWRDYIYWTTEIE